MCLLTPPVTRFTLFGPCPVYNILWLKYRLNFIRVPSSLILPPTVPYQPPSLVPLQSVFHVSRSKCSTHSWPLDGMWCREYQLLWHNIRLLNDFTIENMIRKNSVFIIIHFTLLWKPSLPIQLPYLIPLPKYRHMNKGLSGSTYGIYMCRKVYSWRGVISPILFYLNRVYQSRFLLFKRTRESLQFIRKGHHNL